MKGDGSINETMIFSFQDLSRYVNERAFGSLLIHIVAIQNAVARLVSGALR